MKKASLVIVAVAAGWLAGLTCPFRESRRPLVALRRHPRVRQSTDYSLRGGRGSAVLSYSEPTCAAPSRRALESTPEAGTHPLEILRVAREFGLSAELREGLDLADLERALAGGTTVIVDLQAWRERDDVPWTETWDDGHYMVLLAMDAGNLYFEDPSLLGVRGKIPRAEFVDRWHRLRRRSALGPDRPEIRPYGHLHQGQPARARPRGFVRAGLRPAATPPPKIAVQARITAPARPGTIAGFRSAGGPSLLMSGGDIPPPFTPGGDGRSFWGV